MHFSSVESKNEARVHTVSVKETWSEDDSRLLIMKMHLELHCQLFVVIKLYREAKKKGGEVTVCKTMTAILENWYTNKLFILRWRTPWTTHGSTVTKEREDLQQTCVLLELRYSFSVQIG